MIERIEATLNRLVAFSPGVPCIVDDAVCLQNAAAALESSGEIPLLTELCMSLSVDLLENFPPQSDVTYAVLTLLACCCMRDENRDMAGRFGVFSLCVILLQSSELLPQKTLVAIFDLIATLSMNSSNTRQMMRPCVPYVLSVMKTHSDCLQLAFSGSVAVSTLVMLDKANAELAVENDCIQVLISAFMQGYIKKKELSRYRRASLSLRLQREEEELKRLCDGVIRWTQDALYKLVLSPLPIIDAKLEASKFGDYGTHVEVDELMWKLKFERKKVNIPR
uniref:Uncharacterized protein TCIL3000_11_1640 n=1 Tax=Trypanosoma congolense (strain IL3000) TaxID=1068625 RepID=G0UZG1_TRYCI|nr:unnamed protein product [Trypanosoma congolense IL3000]